ncbi:ComF family protein [Vulcanibacillus modesticaldus]|uniref:ComF family protein n=1 Tax=Vulcanibacillus modesticaldus TaxID=337097 RepID=UPI00159F18B8|nr:ComF family protein [Vulcanibacillus modesticaldus]
MSCHKPLDGDFSNRSLAFCGDCQDNGNRELLYNRSAVLYNSFIKEKITLYKYRGKESLSLIFSYLMKLAYDSYYEGIRIDYLAYVPLHSDRLKERGFNQAKQLTENLHKLTGKRIFYGLERVKHTEKLSKRSKIERIQQVEESFRLKGDSISQIKGKNILIIDDIYTTGSTISECARVLRVAGARNVYGLTLARAMDKIDNHNGREYDGIGRSF